ncbi:hypothetical protein scyTo_0006228, partial [Scyliorhinus torazame]|nr:hypothetical protein [Scyliorhinus torazame]
MDGRQVRVMDWALSVVFYPYLAQPTDNDKREFAAKTNLALNFKGVVEVRKVYLLTQDQHL